MLVLSVVVSPGPGRVITVTLRIKDYAHGDQWAGVTLQAGPGHLQQ